MGGLFTISDQPLSECRHGKKPYALVTGATDGIGKALSFELTRNNFNVIIQGRNPDKLNKVQHEINEIYSTIDVQITVLDPNQNPYPNAVIDIVKELHVTILINCLGIVGDGTFKPLRQAAPSLILNLSSGTAIANSSFLSTYAGSKAYNLAFSHALFNEINYLKTNVHVLAMLLGEVSSANNKIPVSLFCPLSQDFAKKLLDRVGQREPVITGNWQHELQIKFIELMPYWIMDSILTYMTNNEQRIERTKDK